MKTAISVALTIAVPLSPAGESQSSEGLIPAGASPAYTLTSAKIAKATRVTTSMPSRPYCSRADTSMPR